MNLTEQTVGRDRAVDLVKAAAIVGVLTIHVSAAGFGAPIGSFDWLSSLFWGSVSRAAVPLFFMCSGALMLDPRRQLTFRKLWTRSIPRLLAALLFWAFCYQVFDLARTGTLNGASLVQAVKAVLLFRHTSHLYYLHIALLVYAFLPVTRVLTAHADRRQLWYFLALWSLLGILYPTVKTFWPFTLLRGIPVQWMMNMTYAAIGYGVLGHVLSRELCADGRPPKRLPWALLAAAGFAVIFCGTWAGSAVTGKLYTQFMEGMTVGPCLLAAGVYGLCAASRLPKRLERPMELLSGASFCVFLVHVFFLRIFQHLGWTGRSPSLVTIPLLVLLLLLCSCAVYAVLDRIPWVRRWLI